MTRRLTRLILLPLLAFAFGSAAMLLFLSSAHADPVIAVTPSGIELSWQGWLMVGLAAAGGALKVLDVAIAGLKWLAPRTKTTLDDRGAVDLQIVRDDIAAVVKMVGGLIPATGVPVTSTPTASGAGAPTLTIAPPPRDSQAGVSFLGCMIALSIGGLIALALAAPGCTAVQARQTAAVGTIAALDCEAAHLDAQAMTYAKLYAEEKVAQWIGGAAPPDSAKIRAVLAPIKDDLGRCAIAAALAAATVLLKPATPEAAISSLMSSTPAPAAVRAQFEIGARLAGWPPVQLAGGEVL